MDNTVNEQTTETDKTKLERLVEHKRRIERLMSQERAKLMGMDRRADAHIKAAIGGAVLGMADLPKTTRHAILMAANAGIQKAGLARERFNKLLHPKAAAVTTANMDKQEE